MDVMGKCNTECSSIHLAIHNFMRITLRSKINFFHERQALSYNNNFSLSFVIFFKKRGEKTDGTFICKEFNVQS